MPSPAPQALIDRLARELGDGAVLTGDDVRLRGAGWGHDEPCAALAVVRPGNTEEVARTLAACDAARQPVCVQGGMTGLVDGGVADASEVVLSLERLTAIEEVDELGRTMTVQSGVPLQRIQEEAYARGLMFPLDMGARGSCQIGGNVATNAGGNRVIRYGMTRRSVLGLEAVLADGTVLSHLTRMVKNNSGYDLKQLFIGSEGTLGVVTRVVLRLERAPRSHGTALVAVDSFDRLAALLTCVEEELGPQLSAFEVMWQEFYETTTGAAARNRPPIPHGWPYYVLVESLGSRGRDDDERFEEALAEATRRELVVDAVVGKSRAERDRLWAIRDDVETVQRIGPHFTFDVSLPIVEMERYVTTVRTAIASRWPAGRCIVFGHLGDGNLHLAVLVGDDSSAARDAVEECVYGPLASIGGAVSAEHGIGLEKRRYLSHSRSAAEIDVMRRLKQLFDPHGILNRNRVFPWAEEG